MLQGNFVSEESRPNFITEKKQQEWVKKLINLIPMRKLWWLIHFLFVCFSSISRLFKYSSNDDNCLICCLECVLGIYRWIAQPQGWHSHQDENRNLFDFKWIILKLCRRTCRARRGKVMRALYNLPPLSMCFATAMSRELWWWLLEIIMVRLHFKISGLTLHLKQHTHPRP